MTRCPAPEKTASEILGGVTNHLAPQQRKVEFMGLARERNRSRWAIALLAGAITWAGTTAPAQQQQGGQAPRGDGFIQPGSMLPQGRAFHGLAVLRGYVYALGGSVEAAKGEQVPATVTHVAKVLPDGTLTGWIPTTPLREARHYINNSTVVMNDVVYVLGGATLPLNGKLIDTVAWTRPMPDGHLEPWRYSEPFAPTGLSCSAAFATPGYLHITGGLLDEDQVSRDVWSVPINRDGSLGKWEKSPPMPEPLWFHSAGVVGSRVYVWGGLKVPGSKKIEPTKSIVSAPILASGRLGEWRVESIELPVGMYSASPAVAGPYLFAVCPRMAGGRRTTDVWWTYVRPDGMVEWTKRETPLVNSVYHATATDYRLGHIYVSGGKSGPGVMPAPHTNYLKLGERARIMAEEAWLKLQGGTAQQVADASDSVAAANVASTPAAASAANTTTGGSIVPNWFVGWDEGQSANLRQRKPLVVYYYNEVARGCREQAAALADTTLQSTSSRVVFAAINTRDTPQVAQQNAVFRVPTWIFYDGTGAERARLVGTQPAEALKTAADQLR